MPDKEQTAVWYPSRVPAQSCLPALKRFAGLLGLLIALPLAGVEQEFAITRSVIAGGGGSSAGSGFLVEGTIAQPAAGPLLGENFGLEAGFWNRAPTANLATYTRAANLTLKIRVSNLLTNASDADGGNMLSLQSVGAGTNNATVTISGGYIFYQPSSTDPNRNTDDHLNYTVSDGYGGTASSQIWIKLGDPNPGSQGAGISGIETIGGGHMLVKFRGIPGYAYRVQQTTNLSGQSTVWTSIGAATELPANSGYFEFEDANPPGGQAYYRTVWP